MLRSGGGRKLYTLTTHTHTHTHTQQQPQTQEEKEPAGGNKEREKAEILKDSDSESDSNSNSDEKQQTNDEDEEEQEQEQKEESSEIGVCKIGIGGKIFSNECKFRMKGPAQTMEISYKSKATSETLTAHTIRCNIEDDENDVTEAYLYLNGADISEGIRNERLSLSLSLSQTQEDSVSCNSTNNFTNIISNR